MVLVRTASLSTHNLCFEQEYEKYPNFVLSENFPFFVVKFSIYLNRLGFAMNTVELDTSKIRLCACGLALGRRGSQMTIILVSCYGFKRFCETLFYEYVAHSCISFRQEH